MVPCHQVFNTLGRRSPVIPASLHSSHPARSQQDTSNTLLTSAIQIYSWVGKFRIKWNRHCSAPKILHTYVFHRPKLTKRSPAKALSISNSTRLTKLLLHRKCVWRLAVNRLNQRNQKGKSGRCWLHLFRGDAEEQLLQSGLEGFLVKAGSRCHHLLLPSLGNRGKRETESLLKKKVITKKLLIQKIPKHIYSEWGNLLPVSACKPVIQTHNKSKEHPLFSLNCDFVSF